MNVHVPYTVIFQDDNTGSVSSEVTPAPVDSYAAQEYITKACPKGKHVVALLRGVHSVIPGVPVSA